MKKLIYPALLIFILLYGQAAFADQLVYTPVNPSFGGNPINGSFLLSQAQAQNDTTDPASEIDHSRDPMEYFEESLVRRVLNNLASNIVDDAFGASDSADLASGHYQFGDYSIDIDNSLGDNVNVTIIDLITGNTTTVEVPTNY